MVVKATLSFCVDAWRRCICYNPLGHSERCSGGEVRERDVCFCVPRCLLVS